MERTTASKRRSRKRKEENLSDAESTCSSRRPRIEVDTSSDDGDDTGNPSSMEELIDFCNEIDSGINSKGIKFLKKKVSEVYVQFQALLEENRSLKRKSPRGSAVDKKLVSLDETLNGVVQRLNQISEQMCNNTTVKPTYAQKASMSFKLAQKQAEKPPRHVITVYPNEDSQIKSSEETKQVVMASVTPQAEKLKIRNVKKINNNGILIEAATEGDLTNMMRCEKLNAAGLKIGLPPKRKPRMIISDIPKDLEDNELLSAIRLQNLEQYSAAKFSESFNLSFKTGDRTRSTVNWVVEVSPEVRDIFIKGGRVFIGWHACYVRDFTTVSRCYKCQSFGHVSKYCRAQVETCGHCGVDGHCFSTCPNTNKQPTCVNCKRAKKPHEHSSRSKQCPAYKNAVETFLTKIDYGK